MNQEKLFYDDELQAVRNTVERGKGYKATAMFLWPSMKLESAYARLKNCCERPEKGEFLKFGEVIAVMIFNDQFDALYHVCDQTSHARPVRVSHTDEQARLVTVIEQTGDTLARALDQLQRLKQQGPPLQSVKA